MYASICPICILNALITPLHLYFLICIYIYIVGFYKCKGKETLRTELKYKEGMKASNLETNDVLILFSWSPYRAKYDSHAMANTNITAFVLLE